MPNNKKNTVRRKMSMRDYVTFINFIENGERELDLSDCDPDALEKAEVRVMYLTEEQKKELPSFIKDFAHGLKTKQILKSIPKIGLGQFVQVPHVAPIDDVKPRESQPEMMLPGEKLPTPLIGPKDLPHWIKDPVAKLEPSNIDIAEVVRLVEKGEVTCQEMKDKLIALAIGYDNPMHFLAAEPCMFEEGLDDRYRYSVVIDEVIEIAAKKYAKYVAIMTEEPPSDEENADRYLTHVLSAHIPSKHPDLYKISSNADAVTSVAGNKIVFDNDDEKVLEYETAEDMENDFLYLVYDRKIEKDAQVEIFNKKVTAIKIAQRFYKKYPHGLPDQKKFYHTRKEAFEDGALEL